MSWIRRHPPSPAIVTGAGRHVPIKPKVALALALALGAVGLMVLAEPARGTHPRPEGATPLRVSLVVAYKECTSANRTHGAPLTSPSCSPPVQASDFLTIGTRDANGAASNSIGLARFRVKATSPEDIFTAVSTSDVRCKPATDASLCRNANAAGGPDYAGQVQSDATIRVTDHYNGPIGGSGGTDPATLVDLTFPVTVPCATTADTSIGGLCSISTSSCAEVVCGTQWFEGKRGNVELGQVKIYDGGPDGYIGTADNTLFETQGLFVP